MQINGWSVRALPFRKETAAVPLINPLFFFFLADLRAVCAVHRGHRGAGAPNLACPHNEGSALHLPGGLPLLRRREEVSGQLAGSSAVTPSNRWRKSTLFFFFSPSHLEEKIYEFWFIHVFSFFSSFFFPPFSETCDRSSSPSHRLLTFFSSCFSSW